MKYIKQLEEVNLLSMDIIKRRVKLGKMLENKEWCAIKIMYETASSSQLNSFTEEVRLLSQCKSPQIVRLISSSTAGYLITANSKKTISYIVTTYSKYGELYKIIKETGPFDEILARTYFFQLLKGIEYLHSINICHRDIKLENLLLHQDFTLVIADFGCAAKIRMEMGMSLPFDSAIPVGSIKYNAPEISSEKIYYGEKADIFAAGVCLFVMLLGHPPFNEASHRDPYFRRLERKNKEDYWKVYESLNIPPLFKDLFEKLTESNFSKRIELRDIYTHPWMAGRIYTHEEVKAAMHDRLHSYVKLCFRKAREAMKTRKRELQKTKTPIKEKEAKEHLTDSFDVRRRLDFDASSIDKGKGGEGKKK